MLMRICEFLILFLQCLFSRAAVSLVSVPQFPGAEVSEWPRARAGLSQDTFILINDILDAR